jgi:hypothetical protein
MLNDLLLSLSDGMDHVTKQMKLRKAMRLLEEFSQEQDIPVTLQIKGKQITFKKAEPTILDHRFEDFLGWAAYGKEAEKTTKKSTAKEKTTK